MDVQKLRDLCGRLDPHSECRNRVDFRCVVCEAADEIERLRAGLLTVQRCPRNQCFGITCPDSECKYRIHERR